MAVGSKKACALGFDFFKASHKVLFPALMFPSKIIILPKVILVIIIVLVVVGFACQVFLSGEKLQSARCLISSIGHSKKRDVIKKDKILPYMYFLY